MSDLLMPDEVEPMPELDVDFRRLLIQQPVSRWRRWLTIAVLVFSVGMVVALLSFQFVREAQLPFNLFLGILSFTCLMAAWAGLRMTVNIIIHLPRLVRLPGDGEVIQGYLADRWETSAPFGMKRAVVCFIYQPLAMKAQKRYAIRAENNPAAYAALRVGDAVLVRFLPESPQISQLVDYL